MNGNGKALDEPAIKPPSASRLQKKLGFVKRYNYILCSSIRFPFHEVKSLNLTRTHSRAHANDIHGRILPSPHAIYRTEHVCYEESCSWGVVLVQATAVSMFVCRGNSHQRNLIKYYLGGMVMHLAGVLPSGVLAPLQFIPALRRVRCFSSFPQPFLRKPNITAKIRHPPSLDRLYNHNAHVPHRYSRSTPHRQPLLRRNTRYAIGPLCTSCGCIYRSCAWLVEYLEVAVGSA